MNVALAMALASSGMATYGTLPDLGALQFGRRSKRQKTTPRQFKNRVARNRARNRVARAERRRQRSAM